MSVLAAGHRVTVDKRSLRSACGVLVETRIMVRGAPVRRLRLKQSSRSATAWPWTASTAARWLEPPSAALRLARTAASLLLVVCLRHMPAAPARRLSFWRYTTARIAEARPGQLRSTGGERGVRRAGGRPRSCRPRGGLTGGDCACPAALTRHRPALTDSGGPCAWDGFHRVLARRLGRSHRSLLNEVRGHHAAFAGLFWTGVWGSSRDLLDSALRLAAPTGTAPRSALNRRSSRLVGPAHPDGLHGPRSGVLRSSSGSEPPSCRHHCWGHRSSRGATRSAWAGREPLSPGLVAAANSWATDGLVAGRSWCHRRG